MRYLTFEKDANTDEYEVIYDGIGFSGRGGTDPELRVLNKVLDKLEVIGKLTERNGKKTYSLARSGTVELEDLEFSLLDEVLSSVRWATGASRVVTRVIDWFRSSPNGLKTLEAVRGERQ